MCRAGLFHSGCGLSGQAAPADDKPVRLAQLGALAEDIALHRLDALQDAQPALHHHAQFQPDTARQAARQRGTGKHQCTRPRDLELHQLLPALVAAGLGDVVFTDAEVLQVFQRQVDARLLPVDGHILPEVDELQGTADGIRIPEVFFICRTVQVKHQSSYRVRRPAAVVQQVRIAGVTGGHHILAEGREQVAEGLQGQGVIGDGLLQTGEDGMRAGQLLLDQVELRVVGMQRGQSFFRAGVAFIGDVVGAAGKGVDGSDCRPQAGRQQQRGHGEVLVVIDGHGARDSVELVLEQRLDGGDAGFDRLQQGLGHGAAGIQLRGQRAGNAHGACGELLAILGQHGRCREEGGEQDLVSGIVLDELVEQGVVALLECVEFFLGGHGGSSRDGAAGAGKAPAAASKGADCSSSARRCGQARRNQPSVRGSQQKSLQVKFSPAAPCRRPSGAAALGAGEANCKKTEAGGEDVIRHRLAWCQPLNADWPQSAPSSMADCQQDLAVASLRLCPGSLGRRWRSEAGHGLHQLVDIGVQQGFAIGSLDALDVVVGRPGSAGIPVLHRHLVGRAQHLDAQVLAGLAEPQVVLPGVGEAERVDIALGGIVVVNRILAVALGEAIAVVASPADEQVIALAACEDIVAAVAGQDVVKAVAGGIHVLPPELDRLVGGQGVGRGDIGGVAQLPQRDVTAHVVRSAASGVGNEEAGNLLGIDRVGHPGNRDAVVAAVVAGHGHVPEPAGIDAQADRLALLDAPGDCHFIETMRDGSVNTEILEQGLLALRVGAAPVLWQGVDDVAEHFVDGAGDHFLFRERPTGQHAHVGHDRLAAGTQEIGDGIALRVVQLVGLRHAVHQHVDAIDHRALRLGGIEQHQVLDVVVKRGADRRIDRIDAFARLLDHAVAAVVDVIAVVALAAGHGVGTAQAIEDVVVVVAGEPVVLRIAGGIEVVGFQCQVLFVAGQGDVLPDLDAGQFALRAFVVPERGGGGEAVQIVRCQCIAGGCGRLCRCGQPGLAGQLAIGCGLIQGGAGPSIGPVEGLDGVVGGDGDGAAGVGAIAQRLQTDVAAGVGIAPPAGIGDVETVHRAGLRAVAHADDGDHVIGHADVFRDVLGPEVAAIDRDDDAFAREDVACHSVFVETLSQCRGQAKFLEQDQFVFRTDGAALGGGFAGGIAQFFGDGLVDHVLFRHGHARDGGQVGDADLA